MNDVAFYILDTSLQLVPHRHVIWIIRNLSTMTKCSIVQRAIEDHLANHWEMRPVITVSSDYTHATVSYLFI